MDRETIQEAVIAYIESKGGPIAGPRETKLACRYLDAGMVDSMGIIEMIFEFESNFKIRFSVEDLQSAEFQTVAGLISIIGRRAIEP